MREKAIILPEELRKADKGGYNRADMRNNVFTSLTNGYSISR